MSRGPRPSCIGVYGTGVDCSLCLWRPECQEMAEGIESAATRSGTHIRIVSKYKEKKYKPRRIP